MKLPVAIIGGGPVGLAAAAHLTERGEPFVLFEAGSQVGASVLAWGHVRMFSPWEYNLDKAATALLVRNGWIGPSADDIPTGKELVEQYLHPLANLPEIQPHIHTNSKVLSVGRKGLDKMKSHGRDKIPFVIHYEKDGQHFSVEARAIIDASGTWKQPNPLGSGGIVAKGETEAVDRITYSIPVLIGEERNRYAGKRVLVVGSGHSAINTILDLDRLKNEVPETQTIWALRKKNITDTYGGGESDQLPARGALGTAIKNLVDNGRISIYTPVRIQEIKKENNSLTVIGLMNDAIITIENIDEIISNTGSRPDLQLVREIRYQVDPAIECVPALAELIDPNIHSCGTVRPHGEAELRQPEKDFYIVGMKSYGRAPTFLLATGYEQVRSVVAALVGDWEAAKRAQLHLPETGVCGVGVANCCSVDEIKLETPSSSSCCSPTPQKITSCCG